MKLLGLIACADCAELRIEIDALRNRVRELELENQKLKEKPVPVKEAVVRESGWRNAQRMVVEKNRKKATNG